MNFSWKRRFFPFLSVLVIVFSSSCEITRPAGYFKHISRDTVISVATLPEEELRIKRGDILSIGLSSLSKLEDEIFSAGAEAGYEVGNEGEIYIHRLGKLTVQGLTRKQLKAKLEQDLRPYLKDPVAVVTFKNHHITVIGDIGRTQVLQMPAERISIIDVLAQSGTIGQTIELKNVMVIRDTSDNKKLIKHVNLEDHSVFGSDYFYLQPNDVVVLNPDEKRLVQDQKRLKYQQFSSIILQTVTIGLLIYQTFFR